MRWFKHLSNASEDEKLSEILDEHGPEGYGIYWIILEKISFLMDKSSKTSARYSVKKWSKFCGKSPKVFRKFLESFEELSLFRVEICEKNSDFLIIDCPNLLKYRDEYSKKSRQQPDNNQTNSGECQDQDTETEAETETKLKETKELFEKAFEKWWLTYPKRDGRRIGKKDTKKKFLKLKQSDWTNLKTATENYTTSLTKSGLSPSDAHRFLNETWKEYIETADNYTGDSGRAKAQQQIEETKKYL